MKRSFDLVVSGVGLLATGWLILLAYVLASINTGKSGFFRQERVGRHGKVFRIFKIRTMRDVSGRTTTVTTRNDPRITRLGAWFRKTKIDELPQLINVFLGHMSLVGPRPDVPGYADRLEGPDRLILTLRPGITGPATLAFRNEEELLASHPDPEQYNDKVLYPRKVALNCRYVRSYTFWRDVKYICRTIFG